MNINFFKSIAVLFSCVTVMLLSSCEPSDNNKDYGFPKIYIPQATVTGLDNSYPIPLGAFGQNSVYTCYFENGILNIALGVIRAGALSDQKAFSVNLDLALSETQNKVTELIGKSKPAQAMPDGTYSIPQHISVERGNNSGNVYIKIDMNKLAEQRESLIEDNKYKILVLGLGISNPTEYELSDTNTSVVVVLDLNSSHWDNVPENLPESEVRVLFPALS